MSSRSWQASLGEALKHLQSHRQATCGRQKTGTVPYSGESPRVAVVGIGHELCGDDAAGLRLARILQPLAAGNETLLVIEAGPAPENFCGQLRRFRPDLVLLIDAAHMQAQPGTVRWLSWPDTTGVTASTHTLPIHILATYLTAELGCQVALLGIQPADICVGSSITSPVREAAEATARMLAKTFRADHRAGHPYDLSGAVRRPEAADAAEKVNKHL